MLSTFTASFVIASVATAGLSMAQGIQLANAQITFINVPTINSDGTASATAQYNECSVAMPAADAVNHVDAQDGTKSTQEYKVTAYGKQCTMKGGASGATMTCVDASGNDDGIKRVYGDYKYTPVFCPPQCAAACTKVDPSWGPDTAKNMFSFSWYQDPSTFQTTTTTRRSLGGQRRRR